MLLKNNTGGTSRIGYTVKIDTKDPSAFVYTVAGDTNILGVITQSVPKNAKCEIATSGQAKVYCYDTVVKGSLIRAQLTTDNISRGTCTSVKSADTSYFKIGTALQSGKGLINVSLNLSSLALTSIYVPYTGATGDVDLGSNGLTANDITIGGATNNVTIGTGGEMTFNGDATVWDDMRIVPNVFDVPGLTDPDIISYQPAGSGATFKVYAFAKGDEGFFTLQLPHSYKTGSNLKAHVHWTPGTRGNEENGNVVQWRLDYSFAAINSTFPASQTADLSDACDGTDHKHQMSPEAIISGVGLGISSQMWGRIYRWNDASDTWVGTGANLPIFIEVDIHYEIDTMGSKTSTSK
jgi:hypothetical protein